VQDATQSTTSIPPAPPVPYSGQCDVLSRDALRKWVSLPPHPLEEIERLEQLRPLAAGIPIGVTVTSEAPASGIDTEEDLVRANARWDSFMAGAVTNGQ